MKAGILALAAATVLHAARPYTPRAWSADGTGLEIYTETGGAPEIVPSGVIGLGPEGVFRIVVDRNNNIMFMYNVEASRGTSPGTVRIRIKPIGAETEADMMSADSRFPKFPGPHLPTVAGVREFPSVKIGEAVTLDVLYNPSTGVKVFDVLRPITDPSPLTPPLTMQAPARETMSLKDIVIRVNGHTVSAPASWMIGSAVRIDIPGHGAYVVAAEDPKESAPGRAFSAVAHADGKTLSWSIGGKFIEITSSTNVLTQSVNAVLWVYHDPRYRSQDQPDAVRLQSADTVDWLLPKR